MGDGIRPVVRKGEEGLFNTKCSQDHLGLSAKRKTRPPRGIVCNLNIGPSDTLPNSPSDGLKKSLLGCEPARKTFGGALSLLASDDLPLRENTAQESLSPARHQALDSFDVHNVNPGPDNHGSSE